MPRPATNLSKFNFADLDDDDDLELVNPINAPSSVDQEKEIEAHQPPVQDVQSEPEAIAPPLPEPEAPVPPEPEAVAPLQVEDKQPEADENNNAWFFDFDDGDDINDFDDLGYLDGDLPRSPTYVTGTAAEATTTWHSPPRQTSSLPQSLVRAEQAATEAANPTPEKLPHDVPTDAAPLTVHEEPVVDEPPAAPVRSDEFEPMTEVETKLDEASISPLDLTFALLPVPELQSRDQTPAANPLAPLNHDNAALDSHVDQDDGEEESDLSGSSLDEEVNLEKPLPSADIPDIDSLDLNDEDQLDEHGRDDWHTQLADALGSQDTAEPVQTSEDKAPAPPSDQMSRDSEPTPVLPLTKPLMDVTSTNHSDEDDDDVPLPPLLTESIRRKAEDTQPPSIVRSATADLSPEQLTLGVIANVPRLRRLAAAQIGDEGAGDQLVASAIETALANPSELPEAPDLGLSLIKLLLRQRQEMLKTVPLIERTPEEAHTFEMLLCNGLAGADQFEIHQFARAINGLDEEDRTVLILTALESLSYDEIAQLADTPEDQVMVNVADARLHLRQALASDDSANNVPSTVENAPHAQEIEIHGYLDGELTSEHMADIDALVEHDNDAADRLMHYGIQGDLIRRLYAPLLNRSIPSPMLDALASATKLGKRGFRFMPRRTLRASSFMIALGGFFTSIMTIFSSTIGR